MAQRKKKAIKIRKIWAINPKTRVKDSGKNYSRQKAKKRLKEQLSEEA